VARIDWVEQRLRNWALWHERGAGGGLGYATQAAFLADVSGREQSLEARIPVDEIEAAITHEAVGALRLGYGHLHKTLQLFYLRNLGIKGTAAAMRRAESTIHAQLGQADALLAAWFSDRKRRKQAEAAQLRQQIEAARPAKLAVPLVMEPPKPRRKRGTLKLGRP
jgi:hypothetical protein